MRPEILTFQFKGQAAATGAVKFTALESMTIVGASFCPVAFSGTPTNGSAAVKVGATTAIAASALTVTTAGNVATWSTQHTGGTQAPVYMAQGSTVTVDIAFTGGTSPTLDGTLVIWVEAGE